MTYEWIKSGNYWLKQAEKREKEETTATYREKTNKAWKACNDYVDNHRDDQDNFDMSFFTELLAEYVKASLPEIEDERCIELANYCLQLVKNTMQKKIIN